LKHAVDTLNLNDRDGNRIAPFFPKKLHLQIASKPAKKLHLLSQVKIE